jgi:uroporphyrinogen-III synthase
VAKALALRHLCLSAQVAEPLMAAGARTVAVARRPDEASLLALLPS